MNCVKCNGNLVKVNIGEIEVDQCELCSGIWFDLGELEEVLKKEDVDALKNRMDNSDGHDEEKRQCLKCDGTGKMVQLTSLIDPAVHIGKCAVCQGQWLDGGEIERMKSTGVKSFFTSFVKK